MSSSYLIPTSKISSDPIDGRWPGPQGEILVALKRSSNARDVRDGLIGLAYQLAQAPTTTHAICLLGKSRLGPNRLNQELSNFKAVVRPDIGERIWLARVDDEPRIVGKIPQDSPELRTYLRDLAVRDLGLAGDRVNRETVKAFLIDLWLTGTPPVSQAHLSRKTTASAPTVAAAMAELDTLGVLHTSKSGVTLMEPSWDAWRRIAEAYAAKRTTLRFVDPSKQVRPPMAMAAKLRDLQRSPIANKVAIGGVIGAIHYDPTLDITAPPRLDLCVYGANTSFMRQLDAGLELASNSKDKAAVVLHLLPHTSDSDIGTASEAGLVASPLDCLADLLEMELVSESRDFALALNKRGRNAHNTDHHYVYE